jgi:TRAP-type C4-dicarboxylate transport system permease small subunit
MINLLEKGVKKFDSSIGWVSAVLLSIMVLSIVLQVIFRWCNIAATWSTEVAQYGFIWLIFIAGYLGAKKGQHIGVEVLRNWLPPAARRFVVRLSFAVSAVFFFIVLYNFLIMWPKIVIQRTAVLKMPMTVVYLGMMAGCLLMGIYYALSALRK